MSLHSTYIGRAQLDNTGNSSLILPSAFVVNASAEVQVKRHVLALQLRNVTNADAYGGGHVAGGEARYFVVQPLSIFLVARLLM